MAENQRMTADQLVGKVLASEHADIVKQSVAWLCQALMEAEVSAQIGAGHSERSLERVTHRNGYRERGWQTRAGEIELAIPKLRTGNYFPELPRATQAIRAGTRRRRQQAYVNGVSTRKVDRLVEQLGIQGVSRSQVSRLCKGLDGQVGAFLERPLEANTPTCGWTPRSRRSESLQAFATSAW